MTLDVFYLIRPNTINLVVFGKVLNIHSFQLYFDWCVKSWCYKKSDCYRELTGCYPIRRRPTFTTDTKNNCSFQFLYRAYRQKVIIG